VVSSPEFFGAKVKFVEAFLVKSGGVTFATEQMLSGEFVKHSVIVCVMCFCLTVENRTMLGLLIRM
jgi:hypothetical protein